MISKISKFENVAIVFPVFENNTTERKPSAWVATFDIRRNTDPLSCRYIRILWRVLYFPSREEAIFHMESPGQTIRILEFEADLGHFNLRGTLRDWWQP